MKKILIITPFGGTHGSEIYIDNLISSLPEDQYTIKVFVDKPVEPHEDKSQYTYSNVFEYKRKDRIRNFFTKAITGAGINENKIIKIHKEFNPDLWYINTVVPAKYGLLAMRLDIKYIMHSHEMPSIYSRMKGEFLKTIVTGAEGVIGCSNQHADIFSILGARKIFSLPGSLRDISKPNQNTISKWRNNLNINEKSLIIGGCGSSSYMKGIDLFIQMAQSFSDQDIHFIWVGKMKDHGFEEYLKEKVRKNGIENFTATGVIPKEQISEVFGLFDLFFLSSREDTFPLVMLEAAALGIPIFSFENGGATEFVTEKNGYLTEGINPKEMKAAIERFQKGELTFDMKEVIKSTKSYSTELQVENWINIIDQIL